MEMEMEMTDPIPFATMPDGVTVVVDREALQGVDWGSSEGDRSELRMFYAPSAPEFGKMILGTYIQAISKHGEIEGRRVWWQSVVEVMATDRSYLDDPRFELDMLAVNAAMLGMQGNGAVNAVNAMEKLDADRREVQAAT